MSTSFKNLLKIPKQWPSRQQWKRIFEVLTKKEKEIFLGCLIAFLASFAFLSLNFLLLHTEIKPTIGGIYTEGVIGQPRFINPIYATNNDVDRDLTELIFSSLIPDLAQKYEIKEQGLIYEVYLKDDILWQDGEKVTADDVIFTIAAIQDPDYKSPLRANWLGIKTEKISEKTVRFKLKKPYPAFLERLGLKILPSHIWEDIPSKNFPLSPYNLQPIGSGPYQFKGIEQNELGQITSLELSRNQRLLVGSPYLQEIHFKFFESEEELVKAAQRREIDGFALTQPENYSQFKHFKNSYKFSLPRYFAIFFNPQKSEFLEEKEIRQAINYGTDKQEIIEKTLFGEGKIVDSPILPKFYGFADPLEIYEFNPEKAEQLLTEAGLQKQDKMLVKIKQEKGTEFKTNLVYGARGTAVEELQQCLAKDSKVYPEGKITGYFGPKTKQAVILFQEKYSQSILEPFKLDKGTGRVGKTTLAKLNELCGKEPEQIIPFQLTLVTVENPVLQKIAELLAEQWAKLGIETIIESYPISRLEQEFIKQRDYDCLLFGEVLGAMPDPFPFWHSSQKKDPGLNLAVYQNKKADKLLEAARTVLDEETRQEKLQEFQDILIEDAPSLFLYTPTYIYLVSKETKGITAKTIVEPSKRFSGVENWYVKTKRGWR